MTTANEPRLGSWLGALSYVRVSILGTMLTNEVWSVNPVFDPTGEFPGGVNQVALDAAATAIANRTIPTQLRAFMSTSAARTGARVEVRDDVTDALIGISTQSISGSGAGSGTLNLPPQSALVLSLRTDTPGGSGRGRLYWPCLAATLDTNARLSTTIMNTFVADMKSYLAGMRSDLAAAFPTIGFDLAVRSKATHSTPHVVRIQGGNVLDTQRRRRDSIPEAYSTLTFP